VAVLAKADPDVIGFRGAACDAGRLGQVSTERVAVLRRCVDAAIGTPQGGSTHIADAWRNA
jgi:hypothetical protein